MGNWEHLEWAEEMKSKLSGTVLFCYTTETGYTHAFVNDGKACVLDGLSSSYGWWLAAA